MVINDVANEGGINGHSLMYGLRMGTLNESFTVKSLEGLVIAKASDLRVALVGANFARERDSSLG